MIIEVISICSFFVDSRNVFFMCVISVSISLFTWSKHTWLFGGPAFFQSIRAFWILFCCSDWLEKASPPKSHFCFDHV